MVFQISYTVSKTVVYEMNGSSPEEAKTAFDEAVSKGRLPSPDDAHAEISTTINIKRAPHSEEGDL